MAVTPTIQNVKPVVGGSADTWGGTLNDRVTETYVDINALATQGNASEAAVIAKVAKAGDTMAGDLALANVGPTSAYSAGFRGAPPLDFSSDKTLALTDAGVSQRMVGASPLTLTIPPAGSVGFPLGTVIPLRNSTGVVMTVARGAGVTLTVVGSATNANATISARGAGAIWQEATNVWMIQGVGVS